MSLCSVFLDNEGFCPRFHLQIRCFFCVIWVKHSFKMKPLLDCQTIPQTFQLQIPFWCWKWAGCIQQWGVFLVAFTTRTGQKLPVQRGTTGIKYIFIFQWDGLLGWMTVSAEFVCGCRCQLQMSADRRALDSLFWFGFFYHQGYWEAICGKLSLFLKTWAQYRHPGENKSQQSTLSHIIAVKATWEWRFRSFAHVLNILPLFVIEKRCMRVFQDGLGTKTNIAAAPVSNPVTRWIN